MYQMIFLVYAPLWPLSLFNFKIIVMKSYQLCRSWNMIMYPIPESCITQQTEHWMNSISRQHNNLQSLVYLLGIQGMKKHLSLLRLWLFSQFEGKIQERYSRKLCGSHYHMVKASSQDWSNEGSALLEIFPWIHPSKQTTWYKNASSYGCWQLTSFLRLYSTFLQWEGAYYWQNRGWYLLHHALNFYYPPTVGLVTKLFMLSICSLS